MFGSVLERFPEYWREIRQYLRDESDFREMCEDYVEVSQALSHWQTSCQPSAEQIAADYHRLKHELEREILRFLQRKQRQ